MSDCLAVAALRRSVGLGVLLQVLSPSTNANSGTFAAQIHRAWWLTCLTIDGGKTAVSGKVDCRGNTAPIRRTCRKPHISGTIPELSGRGRPVTARIFALNTSRHEGVVESRTSKFQLRNSRIRQSLGKSGEKGESHALGQRKTGQWAVWRRQAQTALLMAAPLPRATQTAQRKRAGALIIGH